MEENFSFVPDMTFYHDIPADKIIEQACKYNITSEYVFNLENEYTASHKK